MRQILFGDQWVFPEEPPEVKELFALHGEHRVLRHGSELLHGGPDGEVTLLTRGLCVYCCTDWQDSERITGVILPGRIMGDIDGMLCAVANVSASVIQDGEALVLPYAKWHQLVTANTHILEAVTRNIILKEECQLEGLLACLSMTVDLRLQALLHSIVRAYYTPRLNDWNPLPLRLNTVMLSKILSTSRTSVSLTISRWTQEGFLKRDGKLMIVHGQLFQNLYDWWADRRDIPHRQQQ